MARKSKSTGAIEAPPVPETPGKKGETHTPKSTKRKRSKAPASPLVLNDAGFDGFELKIARSGKKRTSLGPPRKVGKKEWNQATLDADVVQENPFQGANLSTTYHYVSPEFLWESSIRFKNFEVEGVMFTWNSTVFIKADPNHTTVKDAPVQDWVAKVLEIRALNPRRVYLRVYWLYRPEDLPGGRKPYHGQNELIVSNEMAIVDVMTVNGRANVIHWEEKEDECEILNPEQLFWRQSLDVTKNPPALSTLTKYCTDRAPHNPDKLLIQCDSCHEWIHETCLEEAALRAVYQLNDIAYPDVDTASTETKNQEMMSQGPASFRAEIAVNESGQTRLKVTDIRFGAVKGEHVELPIKCLLCEAIIEDIIIEEINGKDSEEENGESANSKTDSTSPSISGSDSNDAPCTPTTRSIEEDEDEDSINSGEMSSPVKPSGPATGASVLASNTGLSYAGIVGRKRRWRSTLDSQVEAEIGEKRERGTPQKKREVTDGQAVVLKRKIVEMTPPPNPETAPSILGAGVRSFRKFLRRFK